MQISYEKWMSGPSGAPAAMAPELCRGESLPLPGAHPGGAREGGMCTCLEADDVSAHARGPGTGPPVPTASLVQRLTAVLKKRKSSCHSNEG